MNFGHLTLDFAGRRITGRRPFAVLEPELGPPNGQRTVPRLRAELAAAAQSFPAGGALGYFAYEAGALFEGHWQPAHLPHQPLFRLVCYENLDFALTPPPAASGVTGQEMPAMPDLENSYRRQVDVIREFIAAGDIYQANLTHQFSLPQIFSPRVLMDRLRNLGPVPYSALLEWPDFAVVSHSPESFLTLRGEDLTASPIKGTVRRSADPAQDNQLKAWLQASAKDHAENVMIVDLLRNDLGRVCRPGTIAVPELARLVTFPGLHHLVSRVTGKLAVGHDALDAFAAAFPCGSITGAPKIRAMQILALEDGPRGVAMGAVGYFAFNGDMEWNVAIRTAVLDGERVRFRAGGGIVADSDPQTEYEEMRLKATTLWTASTRG